MTPAAIVSLAFLSFAALHSLTISQPFKTLVSRMAGPEKFRAFYRPGFTAFSALITAAAAYAILSQPDTVLCVPPLYVSIPARTIQLAGVIILVVAFRPFDPGRFTGITQALEYLRAGRNTGDAEGMRDEKLVTGGLYGLVRHPMYLAGILIFLCEPRLTTNNLALRVLAVLYFIYGAVVEERRLVSKFGDEYREYQRRVPMFDIAAGLFRGMRG